MRRNRTHQVGFGQGFGGNEGFLEKNGVGGRLRSQGHFFFLCFRERNGVWREGNFGYKEEGKHVGKSAKEAMKASRVRALVVVRVESLVFGR